MIGDTVVIEGKITNIYKHDKDIYSLLFQIQLEICPIFADKINHDLLDINIKYQVIGKVERYKGKLEIIPEVKGDIVEIIK